MGRNHQEDRGHVNSLALDQISTRRRGVR